MCADGVLTLAAESRTVLFNSNSPAEFALQAGKVQNLRIAARSLDGLVIEAGQVFSFWKNVGRASRRRGFVKGRELREGCVIPNRGGGLCQLSNALYDVALRAGCEIVERHAHTQQVPGSTTQQGRDATVFWNYVDLRFRPRFDGQLRVRLTRGELLVALHQLNRSSHLAEPSAALDRCETRLEVAETCETCGVTKCFRNPAATTLPRGGVTAFVVDKFEPEFDQWIAENHDSDDWLFTPLVRGNYRWETAGFQRIAQARAVASRRSWQSRQLATQGAERQRTLLAFDTALAESFASRLPYTADHLVIAQNLLPELWRSGSLGGRTFDVLMTRLPIAELQRTLDLAARGRPESKTLADFRAPRELAECEAEALAAARFWITPHSAIAALAKERAMKVDWILPDVTDVRCGDVVVFPASTLARKGCYEMREVARALGFRLRVVGPLLEGPTFWDGLDVERADENWLDGAAAVVLPAWVEHWPRRLLRAVAAGVPVVASKACGLDGMDGVNVVECGDGHELQGALEDVLKFIPA